MTPLELFFIVCALALVRLVMTLRGRSIPVAAKTADGEAPARASWTTAIKEYLDAGIVAGLVALLLTTFVVRTFYIPSASMEPTLQINDVLLANEFEYRFIKPHDGDIVVFTPATPTSNDFIKRLMAGPGDKLRIASGIVIRNDVPLAEPYEADKPNYNLEIKNYGIYVDGVPLDARDANVPPRAMWSAPDRVPNNCYFMMGDNRNDSEDSHVWGFAQLDGTFAAGPEKGQRAGFTGRAFLLFWPLARARILR